MTIREIHRTAPENETLRQAAFAALLIAFSFIFYAGPPALAGGGQGAIPFSDDFNACSLDSVLDAGWSLVDPVGEATAEWIGGGGHAFVRVTMPANTLYDPWSATGNTGLQLLQDTTPGEPLDVEAGFLSTPAGSFDLHGLIFLEDEDTFVRVDVFRNNTTLRLFFGAEDAGSRSVILNTPIPEGHASFLRVSFAPDTDEWHIFTSADGLGWLEHGTDVNIAVPLNVTRAGLLAGNPPTANDYAVDFDYFLNRTSPFPAGEDGDAVLCGVCGNGIVDDGEDCDDGNRDDQDGCRNHCALPSATAGGSNPFTDDLNACNLGDVLDNGWSLVDPLGAATVEPVGGGLGGEAFLRMVMPNGSDYDPWSATGNDALCLLQDVTGVGDFEVEVAFLTDPVDAFDIQGLTFIEDDDTFVRVELYRYDASETRIFLGTQDGTSREVRLNATLDPSEGNTRFLRVEYRAAAGEWRVWTSVDGIDWTRRTAAPIGFPLATTEMGLAGANPDVTNAYTAEFDYFRNLAEAFDPAEDSSNLSDCSICGNGTINDGEVCDDGNDVDGDGCSANCESGCGTQMNAFSQMVLATDKRTFEWDLPVDLVFAVGDLGRVDVYATDASGTVPAATSLDVGGTPAPGSGLYLLFRVSCPLTTWSTGTPGECCDRDASLP